jgi:hypothetical protein
MPWSVQDRIINYLKIIAIFGITIWYYSFFNLNIFPENLGGRGRWLGLLSLPASMRNSL